MAGEGSFFFLFFFFFISNLQKNSFLFPPNFLLVDNFFCFLSNTTATHGERRAAGNLVGSCTRNVLVVEKMTVVVTAATMAATMKKVAAYNHDYHLRRSWFVSHSKPWYKLQKRKKKNRLQRIKKIIILKVKIEKNESENQLGICKILKEFCCSRKTSSVWFGNFKIPRKVCLTFQKC